MGNSMTAVKVAKNETITPKIKMRMKAKQAGSLGRTDSETDDVLRKHMLKMIQEVAKTRLTLSGSKSEQDLEYLPEVNEKGEIKGLTHGTLWSHCHCSALYPYHSYHFDACVHNSKDEAVNQFDIEVKFSPMNETKQKVRDLRQQYSTLIDRYEVLEEIVGDIYDTPYEEVVSAKLFLQGDFEELEALEQKDYLSPGQREEYEEIISRIEGDIDIFDNALDEV